MNTRLINYANKLPVLIARPIHKLLENESYFTKLYLMSDSLMGVLRMNGFFLKEIYLQKDNQNEELNSIFETLELKESHGLWSSMAAKVVTLLDEDAELSVLGEIMTLYGVKSRHGRTRKIKRHTINNTYTDWKGKTQTVKIENTPLELLINFRNKYLGHGTVFSEEESKKIYELYEPIFVEMLNQCEFLKKLSIVDQKTKNNINGYENSCSGRLTVTTEEGNIYQIDNVGQLSYKEFKPLNAKNQSTEQLIDKEDQKIIDTYPYFLAHTYHRALTETEPFKRIHLLKETFLNYLKYLGLVTASEYFSSDLKVKDINRNFKQFLFRPQFGFWNAFMRETVKALKENKHQWLVKELPGYYKKIESEKKAKKHNDDTGIGALINFRNHYLGHGMVPSREKCEALWVENFAILKELLLEMEFCKNYSIVSKDRNITLRLMGNEITQVNLKTKLESNVAMLNAKNEQISLVPFFVIPGEYFIREVSENAKLMVYEQNTGKRMVFFSPESISGETSGNVIDQLNKMIGEKDREEPITNKQLNKEKFQELIKENNKDFVGGLIKERKVIPEIYQERQDAEIALRSWVGALAGLFFVSAEAGSGKTNLLVEMNRQYNERGIDTLLIRGNRFAGDELWEEIQFRLNLAKDVNLSKSKAFGYTQDNPFIILIDGCNEHPNAEQLFDDILAFLNIHKGGHIKVVLSWRVNTKSELPIVKPELESLIYVDGSDSSDEKNSIAKACHWLKPLNKKEVEGAWDMYTNNKKDKVRRKPNFTLEELTYKDRSLADQLDNPLLMRLFLELYNGKGLPKSRGGFTSIWTLYHQKLISQ
ncbi:ATP-binding protein [Flavobacteriaceae bacterium]|nr:ATP-binding protein [Flavobacteriaceae bacterium]